MTLVEAALGSKLVAVSRLKGKVERLQQQLAEQTAIASRAATSVTELHQKAKTQQQCVA